MLRLLDHRNNSFTHTKLRNQSSHDTKIDIESLNSRIKFEFQDLFILKMLELLDHANNCSHTHNIDLSTLQNVIAVN